MNEMKPVTLRISCQNIRHKMMYVDERHDVRGMVDDSSDTRVFFCVKTHDSLGPDGKPVSPTDCSTGRGCYCAAPSSAVV